MSKAAYMFPGQGSQYVGMGMDVYSACSSARAVFERADGVLGFKLSRLCFEGPADELTLTVNAQPALLISSLAIVAALREAAPETLPDPTYMAGHSLGEYTALAAAGALDFDTAVHLAHERGRLMHEATRENLGTMAAIIGMAQEPLAEICAQTGAFIANLNCPGQIVISGTMDGMAQAMRLAKERGAKLAIRLPVSGAFHSPLMGSASRGLEPYILGADISAPVVPVIGNTTAQELTTVKMLRDELLDQVCHCVRWEDTIRHLLRQGVDTFIEIGPGDVLTGLVQRISPGAATMNIGDCKAIETLMNNGDKP